MDYIRINEAKWNQWVQEECVWTKPISHEDYLAIDSNTNIYLTPKKPVPKNWYLPISGKKVLGLASGGGQQCPIFSALGANVSVIDISYSQLISEQIVSNREKYPISLFHGDMSKPLPFESNYFDMIFNPVSNSYVENIQNIWSECYRVLKADGILLSGFANPTIYLFNQFCEKRLELKYKMPFNPLTDLTKYEQKILFETDGIQFGHTFNEQIAGQLNAGFTIAGFYEDYHLIDNSICNYNTKIGNLASLLSNYMPTYFATKAIKK